MGAAELVTGALIQAESSIDEGKKAALRRIARVETITDPEQAQKTLEAGLAQVRH